MSFLPEERHGVWTALAHAQKQDPKFVIHKLLPTGIVFLAGPPKSMKTTIEMAMALTVAGMKHNVFPQELQRCDDPGRVMFLNAEHTPGELRQMVEDGFGIELPDDDSIMAAENPFQFRLDDPGATRTLLEWLDTYKPKLFGLDPLRDFHRADEKESGHMNRLLRPLQKWAKDNDSCLLVVHHTRKAGSDDRDRTLSADDLRGTSALFGLADGTITLTPRKGPNVHFSVVLKRGEAWEKTIKLGIWGEQTTARIDATVQRVFLALVKDPTLTYDQMCKELHLSKTTVTSCVEALTDLGALDKDRQVTAKGPSLVSNALRTWGTSGTNS